MSLPKCIKGLVSENPLAANVLTYMINYARRYKRNLIITLLDLKDTIDELDHQLINSVLRYHQIPDQISSLVGSFYTNYYILIGTSDFITNHVVVEKGVLLGDSLSPLFLTCVSIR